MRHIAPVSSYSIHNAGVLAKAVLTEAPISQKVGRPVVHAYIREAGRDEIMLIAETLSEEASAAMTLRFVGKEAALRALGYVKQLCEGCGFKLVETAAELASLKTADAALTA